MDNGERDETTVVSSDKRCFKHFITNHWRGLFTVIVPILLSPLLFLDPALPTRCAYLVLLMASFWVTEVIPLYVTSLFPIVFLPVAGIMDSNAVCMSYFKDTVLLFLGGLILALAVEYSNLHYRIGLSMIRLVGCSPRRLLFSMMFVCMFLSMWISNSAAIAMMCPIIKAILGELSNQELVQITDDTKKIHQDDPPYPSKTAICYYLGMAYAASIGGCGTLIGTGTNLTFRGLYETRFPNAPSIDFLSFMLYNVPPMLLHMCGVYLWLQWLYMGLFRPNSATAKEIDIGPEGIMAIKQIIRDKRKELGPLNIHQIQVIILFVSMVILIIFRKPGDFPGWANLLEPIKVRDSAPIIFIVLLLFLLPINYVFLKYFCCKVPEKKTPTGSIITWKYVQEKLPWGLIFVLGGGIALGEGIKNSGLASILGNSLQPLKHLPQQVTLLLCIITCVFFTNFTSNVATCNIISPVLFEMAVAIQVHPLYLGMAACMAFSMSFHLPVGTPPNAIAADFANIRTKDMAIAGIGPSVITIIGFYITSLTLASLIFENYNTFPDWAVPRPLHFTLRN